MKKIAYFLILVPLIAGGWVIQDRATFDREAWLADFEQLKTATEQSYANLKWSRTSKQVDLVALHETTLQQLHEATSNSAARRALATFIAGFQDGHFHIESRPPRPVAAIMHLFERDVAPRVDFTMDAATACSALGFEHKSHDLDVDGATRSARSTFAAGTVRTPGGRVFGVIRIPLFQQREYAAVCEAAWANFRSAKASDCDEKCQDEFTSIVKRNLAQALADDARALMRAGAEAVVVDLTGNGGGTEWAEYAAAALSEKKLRQPDVAFIRGPHWEKRFNNEIAFLDGLLKQPGTALRRAEIERTRADMLAMRDSTRASCSIRAIWKSRDAQPDCWNVVPALGSTIPHEEFSYDKPFSSPVLIMTDARTASASEQFAATLQDNGVARTLGAKTMGVGCGFTDGGNPTTLENSKLVVWMPDCARMRADGSNEFEGVKPDIAVDWGADRASKTAALLLTLDRLPKR